MPGRLRPGDAAGHRGDHRRDRRRDATSLDESGGRGARRPGRSRARSSRSTWPGATRPRSGPTTARSSRCRRRRPPGSASGSLLATAPTAPRLGFAWAGSLDAGRRRRDAGRGPGQRHLRHARPRRRLRRARRRRRRPSSTCGTRRSPTSPTDDKVALALELERQVAGGRPAGPPGRLGRLRRRRRRGRPSPRRPASGPTTRRTVGLPLGVGDRRRGRRQPDRVAASASARGLGDLDLDQAAADAVERATRMLGADQGAARARCTVVFDPRVTSTLLAVVSSALSGEAVVEGPLVLRRPGRRGGRAHRASPWSTIRPTRGPSAPPPTTPRAWPAGATCSSTTACCRASSSTRSRPGGPARRRPARRSGAASPARPGAGCRALVLSARATRTRTAILAAVGEGLYVQSVTGVHSGVNPVSGRLLGRGRGPDDPRRRRWPSRSAR